MLNPAAQQLRAEHGRRTNHGPQGKTDTGKGGGKDDKGWDTTGRVRWLKGLRGEYERRMNVMCTVLDEGADVVAAATVSSTECISHAMSDMNAKADVKDWTLVRKICSYDFPGPMGGMFLWLNVHFHRHPLAHKVSLPRLSQALWVFWTTLPYRVPVSRGGILGATEEIREKDAWKHFRICFAACLAEEVKSISVRLVEGVHAFWEFRNRRKIEEILADEDKDVLRLVRMVILVDRVECVIVSCEVYCDGCGELVGMSIMMLDEVTIWR